MRFIAASLALICACTSGGTFVCGTELDGTSGFHECTSNKEVCICATNSCAVRIDTRSDAGTDCESGYRYSAAPFARPELAGTCVPTSSIGWRIEQGAAVQSCEASRIDGGGKPDAATPDASMPDGGAP